MSFEFFILLQIYVSDFWHFNLGVAALRFVLSQNYGDFTRYSRFQTLGNTSMSNTATPELSHVALLLIWQNFPPISPTFSYTNSTRTGWSYNNQVEHKRIERAYICHHFISRIEIDGLRENAWIVERDICIKRKGENIIV